MGKRKTERTHITCRVCSETKPIRSFAHHKGLVCNTCRTRQQPKIPIEKRCRVCGEIKLFKRAGQVCDPCDFQQRKARGYRSPTHSPDPTIVEQTCITCGLTKPIAEYTCNGAYASGYQVRCRACIRKRRYTAVCESCGRQIKAESKQCIQCLTLPPLKSALRIRALNAVKYAIRRGELVRPAACSKCGGSKGRIEAHHPSYYPADRLKVRWFCSACHAQEHSIVAAIYPPDAIDDPQGWSSSYDSVREEARRRKRAMHAQHVSLRRPLDASAQPEMEGGA